MGGVGVGIWNSYEEAAELVNISKRFTPNEETIAIYDRLYPIYKQAYPTLKETFDKIAAYQVEHMREEE